MGFLKEKHGVMLLGKTKPGVCPECAVEHDPRLPHNRDSFTYQYKFYDTHGRWPTWVDAMEHCSEDIKQQTREILRDHGVEV